MGARAFKSHHGHYLGADGDSVYGSYNCGGHEHWHVENHGSHITLRSHHGKYLAADSSHRLFLHHDHHHDDCHFHLENHGNRVAIRGHHGRYVGIDNGQARLHHECGHEEKFEEFVI